MSQDHAATPPAAERNARGQFARGNRGGPGNATARRMAEIREAVYQSVSTERLLALINRLYEWAMKGNLAAAKLLLQYLLGRPVPIVGPDDDDRPAPDGDRPEPPAPAPTPAQAASAPAPAPEAPAAVAPPVAAAPAAGLSPLARSVLRRAARKAAKKAGRAKVGTVRNGQ